MKENKLGIIYSLIIVVFSVIGTIVFNTLCDNWFKNFCFAILGSAIVTTVICTCSLYAIAIKNSNNISKIYGRVEILVAQYNWYSVFDKANSIIKCKEDIEKVYIDFQDYYQISSDKQLFSKYATKKHKLILNTAIMILKLKNAINDYFANVNSGIIKDCLKEKLEDYCSPMVDGRFMKVAAAIEHLQKHIIEIDKISFSKKMFKIIQENRGIYENRKENKNG